MHLALISGAYPPDLDGIGDYTWWLARTLAAQADIEKPLRVFTSSAVERTATPAVELWPVLDPRRFQSFRDLHTAPTVADLDWLVLQYNPFSYGRRGYCPWVPRTLERLKRLRKKLRIAVMFHETVVPRWPWKFALMHCWQQPIFRAVCRSADVAFVSTERWTPQVSRAAPRLPVHHLPVGSNIPLSQSSRAEARLRLGIDSDALVLGVFGSAHISRSLDWIGLAARRIAASRPKVCLLYVGPDGRQVAAACHGVPTTDAGFLSGPDAGLHFRAMDVALAPFLDGVSTRRASVIALLQHGIPVATNRTAWTDRLFTEEATDGILLSAAKSGNAFAEDCHEWLGRIGDRAGTSESARRFHDRHFEWTSLAAKMTRVLAMDGC